MGEIDSVGDRPALRVPVTTTGPSSVVSSSGPVSCWAATGIATSAASTATASRERTTRFFMYMTQASSRQERVALLGVVTKALRPCQKAEHGAIFTISLVRDHDLG